MTETTRTYVPAAGRDWMLPVYDPLVRLMGAGPTRRALVEQADLQPVHRVLEIGCGTGGLLIVLARLHPGVTVVGLDPDPKALVRARRKAARAAVSIQLERAFADEMPYPDASFDRVFSSFMFHHLQESEKMGTLREVRRVLKPGGRLLLLDFAGHAPREQGRVKRTLHSNHRLAGNGEDHIIALMRQAGLRDPKNVRHDAVLFGHVRINYYDASAPASEPR